MTLIRRCMCLCTATRGLITGSLYKPKEYTVYIAHVTEERERLRI